MPEPNLIHPVDVKVEQRDIAATIYDEDTREPIRQSARVTQITIQAQILWDYHDDPSAKPYGLETEDRGYFLVKLSDMASIGVTLRQGDRIVEMGGVTVNCYVTRTRPMGHYPGLGATLLRVFFVDRSPTQGVGQP